ncbi:ribosome production factor 2 homolog [Symsagittifera roscoffensis]|uniref:ribosome production factor 2 homolog n=1 Tax=Symsagittifera roscoffensis TaxID=84072 RepID=UPI00307B60A6
MAPLRRIEKPKSHKGRKFLLNREPKIVENEKFSLFFRCASTCTKSSELLADLHHLKKPHAVFYGKMKQELLPFEDPTPVEKFCRKNDASLFSLSRHSKKKPNALICGRLYNGNILDMFEFLVEDLKPVSNFLGNLPEGRGNKPLLVFAGDDFEKSKLTSRIRSFFVDYFRGIVTDKFSLQGVKSVISFFLIGDSIQMMPYAIKLAKSGVAKDSAPRVDLVEIGPQVTLKVARSQLATDDLYQESLRKPKELMPSKRKNISMDEFNSQMGRVHMEKQDFSQLQLRKVKRYRHLEESNAGLPAEIREKLDMKTENIDHE